MRVEYRKGVRKMEEKSRVERKQSNYIVILNCTKERRRLVRWRKMLKDLGIEARRKDITYILNMIDVYKLIEKYGYDKKILNEVIVTDSNVGSVPLKTFFLENKRARALYKYSNKVLALRNDLLSQKECPTLEQIEDVVQDLTDEEFEQLIRICNIEEDLRIYGRREKLQEPYWLIILQICYHLFKTSFKKIVHFCRKKCATSNLSANCRKTN